MIPTRLMIICWQEPTVAIEEIKDMFMYHRDVHQRKGRARLGDTEERRPLHFNQLALSTAKKVQNSLSLLLGFKDIIQT